MKKLVISSKLCYEPLLEHSHKGSCTMKCPLGNCRVEILLESELERIVQVIDIKGVGGKNDLCNLWKSDRLH